MAIRIRNWQKHFENNRTRELKRMDRVQMPNRMDSFGYAKLVNHPNGAAYFGAWLAIVEIASRQDVRGTIPHDTGTIPHYCGTISRLPDDLFKEVIPRLLEITWIEEIPHASVLISHDGAAPLIVQDSRSETLAEKKTDVSEFKLEKKTDVSEFKLADIVCIEELADNTGTIPHYAVTIPHYSAPRARPLLSSPLPVFASRSEALEEKKYGGFSFDFEAWFEAMYVRWKKLGIKRLACQYLTSAIHDGAEPVAITTGLEAWCQYWESTGWRFCKLALEDWAQSEGWKMAPPEAQDDDKSSTKRAMKILMERQQDNENKRQGY